jgi:hypothetical protein
MSDHEIEDKFRRLAAGKIDRTRVRNIVECVWKLDELKDISALMPLMMMNRRN